MAGRTTFGAALSGEGHRALRRRVRALAARRPRGGSLHADGLLALFARLASGEPAAVPPARSYLLFDLHRLLLFEERVSGAGGAAAPGIGSVVRSAVDGYPLQPMEPLLGLISGGAQGEPHPFLFSLEVLEVLPALWARARPGWVTVCDLRTGVIEVAEVRPHPAAGAERDPEPTPGPAPLRLRQRLVDRSLRPSGRPDLGGLVSGALGPVRELRQETGFSSLPYAATVLARHRGARRDFCFGKAFLPDSASAVALCEALERYQVARRWPGEELVRGPHAELRDRAVDPRRLFFGRAEGCDGDELPPWADDVPLHWTRATGVAGEGETLVPAQEVWFDAARLPGETRWVKATTNGCAVGRTLEDAALFALLEAVERDAFLVAWYLRRRCPKIDLDSVEHLPFQLLRRRFGLVFGGYDLHLLDLTSDTRVPAVLCLAVRREGEGPRVFVAAAAHLSVAEACFGALKDVTGFTPPRFTDERREELRALAEAPELMPDRVLDRVKGPADHFALWGLDEAFPRLGFLDLAGPPRTTAAEVQARGLVPPAERHDLRAVLGAFAGHLRALGVPLLLKDLTHPWVADRGLRCVRAIAPGLYPIWYGGRTRRFAVTARLRRLALELTGRPVAGPEDCNLFPHPFT